MRVRASFPPQFRSTGRTSRRRAIPTLPGFPSAEVRRKDLRVHGTGVTVRPCLPASHVTWSRSPRPSPARQTPLPRRRLKIEISDMEVRLFPNLRRPAVGLKPRREAQRPLLPQHARHWPVLEAGSSLGFLVYPPYGPKNQNFAPLAKSLQRAIASM